MIQTSIEQDLLALEDDKYISWLSNQIRKSSDAFKFALVVPNQDDN